MWSGGAKGLMMPARNFFLELECAQSWHASPVLIKCSTLTVAAAAYLRDLGKISQDILHALVDLHLVDRSVWQKLAAAVSTAVGTLPLLQF